MVAEHFRAKGLEQYLPLYSAKQSWSDREKTIELPLFPNYVFFRCDFDERLKVLRTPGVFSLVSFGDGPAAIPGSEIEAVRKMAGAGLPVRPWPFCTVGQTLRIRRGPLAGVEGIVLREQNLLRVVVSIELLQRSVAVEIDRDMLETRSVSHVKSTK